uniref:DUF4124 domain-containing protein n=1 Tax=Fundidesulfovibrio putealis TaxID=270496 RepID=A0A7C4EJ69_9BACT
MKSILLAVMALALAVPALAQQPKVYQCVRPDGTVVCTVQDTSGDPSVTCNYECVDCNLVCVAQLRLSNQNGMTPVPPPAVKGKRQPAPATAKETPEYCLQRYQKCEQDCRSNPLNKTAFDVEACLASCKSWYSGCGMQQ